MTPAKKTSKPKSTAQKTARKIKENDEPPDVIRHCSFCGRPSNELVALVQGPNNIFICDKCIETCVSILLQPDDDKINHVIWWKRIFDLLANNSKFDICTVDEAQKGEVFILT